MRNESEEGAGGGECRDTELDLLNMPTEALYQELRKVDPVMAERWHPKDRRKIQRSLEIYMKTGSTASGLYADQKLRKVDQRTDESSDSNTGLRFPTLIFWVHAEQGALRERLDRRVDKMLDAGLLEEVRTLNAHAASEAAVGTCVDETRGIWVSIGYKEFKAYSQALENRDVAEAELERSKADALEKTKIATRQYAKRQIRWIRIKLLNSLSAANATHSLYLLDGSDLTDFAAAVVQPALELTNAFLTASPMPEPSSLSPTAAEMLKPKRDYDVSATPEKWAKQHCEVCDVTCVIQEQWQQHVTSKSHKKRVSKARRGPEGVSHRSTRSGGSLPDHRDAPGNG